MLQRPASRESRYETLGVLLKLNPAGPFIQFALEVGSVGAAIDWVGGRLAFNRRPVKVSSGARIAFV